MQEIPLAPLPNQAFNVVLDDQDCTIRLYQKEDSLYLDLRVGGRPVRSGAICQNGPDILQSPSPYFKGSLHFFDTSGNCAPNWRELGTRHRLLYFAEGESLPLNLRF